MDVHGTQSAAQNWWGGISEAHAMITSYKTVDES
jgi:hypothetical protein